MTDELIIIHDDQVDVQDIMRQIRVNIARRTVAKYREAMRIPSSVERRRLKSSDPLNASVR